MHPELDELIGILQVRRLDDRRFEGNHATSIGGRVVFGGQLLAQMVMAAAGSVPDKSVKSLQAVFVRAASLERPVFLDVEVMHSGRLYSSTTVSVHQDDRLCARALVLLDTADVELARHAAPFPELGGPDSAGPLQPARGGAELRVVGGVDLNDPDDVGPPELAVWTRFPDAPVDDAINRALLAFASEPLFFAAALRPHAGLSQASVYSEIIPAVITHSIYFHAPIRASSWMLLQLTSPHVGRGRIYGYGSVFDVDGQLVASANQENQLRPVG
jgi:acyl-CoA thioesterase